MLGDSVELAAVIKDIVLLSTGNVLIALEERNRVEQLTGIITLVLGEQGLL
jgi:hypothetical protein